MVTLIMLRLPGCASTPKMDSRSPTGGLSLRLLVRDVGHSNSLYRVDPDGTIGWGGAYDAVNGKLTWTGTMSQPEIDELHAALRTSGWLDGAPRADAEAAQVKAKLPEYEAKLTAPGVRRQYHIKGPSRQMEAVRAVLERITRRRNEAFLQTLPKPGMQQ